FQFNRELHLIMRSHLDMILIIVNKQETRLTIRSNRVSEAVRIRRLNCTCPFRKHCCHWRQTIAESIKESMQRAQQAVGCPNLPKLADLRLKIISDLWCRTFIQIAGLANRICSAVEHVIPNKITAASQLDHT